MSAHTSPDSTLDRTAGSGPLPLAPKLPSRIPSLDGMRAVCILMVVIAHSIDPDRFRLMYHLFGHLGNCGVRIFFLISGFLITGILLKEYDRHQTISLKNFYMRRMIRIFPAFYVYVGAIGILASAGVLRLLPGDMLHTLTYTMNYHMDRAWYLNHTWSLSVEEQFYLLWPAVLLFAAPKRALRFAWVAILIVPLIRVVMYFEFAASPTALGRHFEAVCDALATGCLLAGYYNRLGENKFYRKMQSIPGYIIFPVLVVTASGATYKFGEPLYYIVGQTVANIGGILLLDYVVRVPESFAGKILNTAPLMLIGAWSYSIYLWQEVFLDAETGALDFRFPFNIMCVTAASLLSYYGVEKQFLKLRKYFKEDPPPRAASRGLT